MQSLHFSNKIKQFKLFIFYCLVFISLDAIARAGGGGGNGGGGGSHGGHGGGDGFGAIIYFIIFSLPFPLNIIVIAAIFLLAYLFNRNQKQSSVYNNLVGIDKKYNTAEAIDQLVANIPNFSQTEFYDKATTAFFKIQDAWQKQNLSAVRQFISDGIYQRFEAQFIMMRELEQSNAVSDIEVEDLRIVAVENDTYFHIIHLSITASMTDNFVSKKYSDLNSGGYETFTEYWTFVKKVNATGKINLFDATNCPNCADSIENKLGEVSQCPSCGTQINNGAYDWILSEITQAEEFASNYNQQKNRTSFYKRLTEKGFSSSEFSPQYIEDKASNAYLQLKIATALGDQKRIARFCSNTYTEKTKNQFNDRFLYNRLFIKDASLVNVYETETAILAALSITSVTQKVSVNNSQLKLINASAITTKDYLILSRSKKMTANTFSAMAHNCSNCGAPVEDSLQLTCKYCDAALNDNSKDWIVENLCSPSEYLNFKTQFDGPINTTKQEAKLEFTGLDPRDYALNNMMVVACADGIIQSKEKLFLINTAEEMGSNASKIKELFEQVKSSGLALKMPKDGKERAKILKLMHKIANIDGDFNVKEKEVLVEAESMK
jgi:tellurite resistance protein/ribosomal protein L37AE/L43A